ncbi:MAG: hypothetical protein IT473_11735 [Lysobacter sp.]|nr:hypothetical protein [Lysobacter sp.]
MTSKWLMWAATAAFVFGSGVSFESTATGGCNPCRTACKNAYNQCLASGQPAATCLSRYTACRADCAC